MTNHLRLLLLVSVIGSHWAHASDPYNPDPCTEPWVCVTEPQASISASGPSTPCVGKSATFTAVVTITPGTKRRCDITDVVGGTEKKITWQASGPGGFSANGDGKVATFTPPTEGAYAVGWSGIVVADDPCKAIIPISTAASATAGQGYCQTSPSLAMSASGPPKVCLNTAGTWTATVTETPGTSDFCGESRTVGSHDRKVKWTATGPNAFTQDGEGETVTLTPAAEGDYRIIWTVTAVKDAPCSGVISSSAYVTFSTDPGTCRYNAVITPSAEGSTSPCTGVSQTYTFVTTIAPGLIERCGTSTPVVPVEKEITWKLSGPNGIADSGNGRTVTYTANAVGTYTITWTGSWYGKPPCTDPMTSSTYHIFTAKCCASASTVKAKYKLPEVEKYWAAFGKKMKQVPWVKSFSASTGFEFESVVGEECCPSAAFPTTYTTISGKLTGSASLEVLAPPPLATAGVFAFGASTPGISWIGLSSHEIFRAYGRWQLGLFAGLAGKVEFGATGKVIGCDKCVVANVTLDGKVTIGLTATGSGTLSVGGGAFGGEVSVTGDAKATTGLTFSATGNVVGDCPLQICGGGTIGGIKTSVTVTGTVKSGKWVNVSFSWDVPGPSADPIKIGPYCYP